jgi:hypothetical protein
MAAPLIRTKEEHTISYPRFVVRGHKNSEIYGRMAVQYGHSWISNRKAYEWVEKFKGGRMSLVQDACSGRSSCNMCQDYGANRSLYPRQQGTRHWCNCIWNGIGRGRKGCKNDLKENTSFWHNQNLVDRWKSRKIKYKNTSFEIYIKIVFKFLLRHPCTFAALPYVYYFNPNFHVNCGLMPATVSTDTNFQIVNRL